MCTHLNVALVRLQFKLIKGRVKRFSDTSKKNTDDERNMVFIRFDYFALNITTHEIVCNKSLTKAAF